MSFRNGASLIQAINGRGWNLYKYTGLDYPKEEDIAIRRGHVSELEVGHRYVLRPIVDDPCDFPVVKKALDRVMRALKKEMPTVDFESVHPLSRIWVTHRNGIEFCNPPNSPNFLDYSSAVSVAEKLFNAKTLRYE